MRCHGYQTDGNQCGLRARILRGWTIAAGRMPARQDGLEAHPPVHGPGAARWGKAAGIMRAPEISGKYVMDVRRITLALLD